MGINHRMAAEGLENQLVVAGLHDATSCVEVNARKFVKQGRKKSERRYAVISATCREAVSPSGPSTGLGSLGTLILACLQTDSYGKASSLILLLYFTTCLLADKIGL